MFPIEEDNGLESILAIPRVQEILEVRKYRDILLDFEYKDV